MRSVPAALAFAFWDEDFKLPLRVTPQRRTVQASVATLVEVNRAGAILRGSVTVEPRYAPLFDLELQLPRGWEIAAVLSAGKPVAWELARQTAAGAAADAALQTIRLNLAKPLNPERSLQIALTAQLHPEDWLDQSDKFHELPLPCLRVIGADEVEGTLLLQSPPDIDLLATGLSDDLQPVAAEEARGASAQTQGTALQYRYRDDARFSGRLQVRAKPARVSAETLTYVRLDRGKLDVHYQLDLHIRQGNMRRIAFALPAAVGEKIQVAPVESAARVIEQTHSLLPKGGSGPAGSCLWQIVLDQPVTGDLTLAVDFGQTFATSAEAGTRVEVPVLALQNVSRQSGMVAVEAAGDQQIDCKPENLHGLDPADVLKPRAYVPKQRIVAAYQYRRLPYRLGISAASYASAPVLTAVCESAEITSVPEEQGRMRHQRASGFAASTCSRYPWCCRKAPICGPPRWTASRLRSAGRGANISFLCRPGRLAPLPRAGS